MNTFHSRQSDCDRHARKNENTGTFNFTSQIAPSICTVAFTKCEKSGAIIFTSRCSRLSLVCIFRQGHALPLSFVRFSRLANRSTMNWRNPARRSRNGRESSVKISGEMPRLRLHIYRAIDRQSQMQCYPMSARQFVRQLASWGATVTQCPHRRPGNSRCNISRNVAQDDCSEFRHHDFKPKFKKL
jgi:hypothetical protein